jgi:hypothetical protein
VLVGSWFWLIRSIPRGRRALALASLLAGTAVGLALYIGVVGPRLLP